MTILDNTITPPNFSHFSFISWMELWLNEQNLQIFYSFGVRVAIAAERLGPE